MIKSKMEKNKSKYSLPEKIPLFVAVAMVVLGILTIILNGVIIGYFEDTELGRYLWDGKHSSPEGYYILSKAGWSIFYGAVLFLLMLPVLHFIGYMQRRKK